MKTQKLILGITIIGILLMGCSKNDDDVIPVEVTPQYPMKSLIESGHMELKSTMQGWVNSFEIGYKFKTFKNGKITALGVRVPTSDDYRVTLWNIDTEQILMTAYVTATSQLLSFEDIAPIDVSSGTNYFVSINTNDYYTFNDSGNDIFPVEIGDILITNYGVRGGTNPNQIMPTQYSNSSYVGMVDIKFVKDN